MNSVSFRHRDIEPFFVDSSAACMSQDGRVVERRPGWQRNLRRRMPRPVVRALRELQRVVRRRTRG